MISTFKLIKVQVINDSQEIHTEYINAAHIMRFYQSDNIIIIELVNNVKLNIININLDILCERFIS